MSVKIERLHPRDGLDEQPVRKVRGYELVAPYISKRKHYVENSTFVSSIEEAADLVHKGYSIRMGAPGKRDSLIRAASLRIVVPKVST